MRPSQPPNSGTAKKYESREKGNHQELRSWLENNNYLYSLQLLPVLSPKG
jgi:hypothetical protein